MKTSQLVSEPAVEAIGQRTRPTRNQTALVDVNNMPWQETPYPGIQMKMLWHDEVSGASTILFKFAPGAKTPLHEHTALEQTYVLDGWLSDHDGTSTAGNYAVRIAGSVHQAQALPSGSLHIAFFSGKNRMLEDGHKFP